MTLFRFSSHEVKLEIDCLQELIGMRVGNIHQIDKDTILIKFWKLGVSRNLLIENGIRFHLTEFPREKPKTPPAFCVRLRKYLRFRRLDDIIQPGNDRAVYFIFGDLRLCLELFQAGNIILFQNSDNLIIALLRYHVIQGKKIVGVNQPYMVDQFRDYVPPTDEEVHNFFKTQLAESNQKLRGALTKIFNFHRTDFVASALTIAKVNPDLPAKDYQYNEEQVNIFIREMRVFDNILLSKPAPRPPRPPKPQESDSNTQQPANDQEHPQQEINDDDDDKEQEPDKDDDDETMQKEVEKAAEKDNDNDNAEKERPVIPIPPGYIYAPKPKERFLCGVQLAQWDPKFVTKYDSFDTACDHFWSISELETAQKAKKQAESVPEKKVNSVKKNFEKKKNQLQSELDTLNKTGQLIHKYVNEIEQCRLIINNFIANHVRWDEIRLSIRAYQESGNELARMIDKVEFEQGKFWVLLTDDDGEVQRVLIDLRKTAYANASSYFDKRGGINEKLTRTTEKESEVVKKVDREAQASKKNVQMTIQERRKTWWFERFHWFITSENYLVLAGRDRLQNDVLFRHYLKKDDIYLHAEIHGAASVIVKNPFPGKAVSPISIQQAAEFAVSRSNAWKSNEPCECFWVHAWQVKKNLPGQQQAPPGAFYIVGEKNMITMTMPQMGLGVLFQVTEAHVSKHINERRIKVDDEDEENKEKENEEKENNDEAIVSPPNSEEINAALAFPNPSQSGDIEKAETTNDSNNDNDNNNNNNDNDNAGDVDNEEEEEADDDEEEITDEELARIALEEPERADVARRRMERKAKKNRPKPKPQPLEEGVAEVMESEGMNVDIDVTGINALTGCPKQDDEFYAAYSMVAPLSALNTFKYKVKFVPGDTKKGKAWPIIMNYFTSMKGIPPAEQALIKLMPANDVINQLPFNLKLSLGAGGSNANKKKATQKKGGKKKGKK